VKVQRNSMLHLIYGDDVIFASTPGDTLMQIKYPTPDIVSKSAHFPVEADKRYLGGPRRSAGSRSISRPSDRYGLGRHDRSTKNSAASAFLRASACGAGLSCTEPQGRLRPDGLQRLA
jgi:hypothetical protein